MAGLFLNQTAVPAEEAPSMFGPERVKVFHSDVLQHQPQPLEGLWLVNVSRRAHGEHDSSGECREFPG